MSRRSLGWLAVAVTLLGCVKGAAEKRKSGVREPAKLEIVHWVYDGGLKNGWSDIGWSPRELPDGKPARLNLSEKGGWILSKDDIKGPFGGILFHVHAPDSFGDFLEVRVDSSRTNVFPRVKVGPQHRRDEGQGWSEVFVPAEELNPQGHPYDRIVFRAHVGVGSDAVLIDKVAFTQFDPVRAAAVAAGGARKSLAPAKPVAMSIQCRSSPHRISPLIYGIAIDTRLENQETHQYELGATIRRWGGNTTSRYNWKIGNAWNTGNDYFFMNVETLSYQDFFALNRKHGLQAALTVPILGWVAKDTESVGFPVARFPNQQVVDPHKGQAGNGVQKDGSPIFPGPPETTSVAAPPELIGEWISTIRTQDAQTGRSVHMYILDNEPMLWSSTHRDVHPVPATYDELLTKTIKYGTAVRKADPDAIIAGPAEWGWTNYLYSAADVAEGFTKSDRKAHGNVELIAWYLRKLKEHEQRTGVRILDVVDLHFYPQTGVGVGEGGATDPATNAKRIRSTRALWDPNYKDESWIDEKVQLIPRVKRWIADNYPGRGISIGEYNFGATKHMSGGLAQAETLGRFAQGNITSAFFWQYPPKDSPTFWAFRAFRNYDGKQGRFLDNYLESSAGPGASLFASRNDEGTKMVAIALNFEPDLAMQTSLDLSSCGRIASVRMFGYTGEPTGFAERKPESPPASLLRETLPPYSITVFEIELGEPPPPEKPSAGGGKKR